MESLFRLQKICRLTDYSLYILFTLKGMAESCVENTSTLYGLTISKDIYRAIVINYHSNGPLAKSEHLGTQPQTRRCVRANLNLVVLSREAVSFRNTTSFSFRYVLVIS